jgi:hypothetical protein
LLVERQRPKEWESLRDRCFGTHIACV